MSSKTSRTERDPYAAPATVPEDPALFALLIGVDDYEEYPERRLGGSVADIERWEKTVWRLGCRTITTLKSPYPTSAATGPTATKRNIDDALEAFAKHVVESKGRGILVFAGHAFKQTNGTTGAVTAALCPQDVDRPSLEPPQKVITAHDIQSAFDSAANGSADWSLTVVLDCCFGETVADPSQPIRPTREKTSSQRRNRSLFATSARGRLSNLIPISSLAEPPVVWLTTGRRAAVELYLAHGWVGALTYAATQTLASWRLTREPEALSHYSITGQRLAEESERRIEALGTRQRSACLPRGSDLTMKKAIFQDYLAAPGTTLATAAPASRGIQLSAGLNGFRIYLLQRKVSGSWSNVGKVLAVGPNPKGTWSARTEYWFVKPRDIENHELRLSLLSDGVDADLGTLPASPEWSVAPAGSVNQPNWSGTINPGSLTWKAVATPPLPIFKVRALQEKTLWLRSSSTEVMSGASPSPIEFEPVVSQLIVTNGYRTDDTWA